MPTPNPSAQESTGLQCQPPEELVYGAAAVTHVRQGAAAPGAKKGPAKRDYLIAAVLCYGNLINFMDWFIVPGILLDVQKYFDLSDGDTGLLQTVFILCYMLAAPLFGYLGDRYNRKIILGAGICFWSAVTLGSSFLTELYSWIFFLSRGLVGLGTASYSTVAPTMIADLFEEGQRTTMLSIFYIFIPVGSGLGYVLAAGMAELTGDWHWAFRVSYSLALLGLSLSVWSFVWSSLGLTAMAFVTGALGMWVPLFLYRAQVVQGLVSPCLEETCNSSNSLIFGGITIGTGILGVIAGAEAARRLRKVNKKADPLICAASMFISALCLYIALMVAQRSILSTFIFLAFGELFLSVNWAVVTDILLYVVTPRRQSTAIALQILVSHLLGDAGSPYLIGTISSAIQARHAPSVQWSFWSMQYSFILCAFLGVCGGGFFFLTSFYIEEDRKEAERL
ncbi:LOW QUALITY PROTEIN: protein spinster homolog 3-like [Melanerpes formicivorus]|uniref:LOW QUALITY PROTEIN: protein spinster homolog 3-like n=1 Tax=Melanerpes formicivorus TaxID=211600 RepID=UPI00358EA01E